MDLWNIQEIYKPIKLTYIKGYILDCQHDKQGRLNQASKKHGPIVNFRSMFLNEEVLS